MSIIERRRMSALGLYCAATIVAVGTPLLEGNVPNWIKVMSISRPKLAAAAATGAEIVENVQATVEEVIEGQDDEQAHPQAPPFKPYSITLNAGPSNAGAIAR